MFFKINGYVNKNSYHSGSNTPGIEQIQAGPTTIFVNTENIKSCGYQQDMYNLFIDFKTPPFPYSSQTFFVFSGGTPEGTALKALLNYIEGTETF